MKPLNLLGIVLKNLSRRPMRTWAMALGIASIACILFVVTIMYIAVEGSLLSGMNRLGADAIALPSEMKDPPASLLFGGTPSSAYMPSSIKEAVGSVEGVSAVSAQLFVVSAHLDCCSVSDTVLIGFEPEDDFTITPWLRERLGRSVRENEIIVGANILAEPTGRMKFYGREFVIAGKLEPTGMGFIDSSVFMPMKSARGMIEESGKKGLKSLEITADSVSAIMIKFKSKARAEEVAVRIEMKSKGAKVVLASDALRSARKKISAPLKAVAVTGVVQWSSSLFLIAVIFGMSASERRKEIGLLYAMGARRSWIRRLFLCETSIISVLGAIVGIVSGLVFTLLFENLIRRFLGTPFLLPGAGGMLVVSLCVFVLSVLSGVGVTIYPIMKASRMSPYDVVRRYE